jgi:choline dehydrogenase
VPSRADPYDAAYDYVIVGGGSAGCALANRLSVDPGNRVLVLEAGRMDWKWDVFIHMPAALTYPIGNRFYDWKYETEPEPHLGGRKVYHARGKVVGGSSSINGMIFQRGNPADYEKWAVEPGMEAWDYAHCLPYFKRMETCLAGEDEWRGGDGPLILERGPAENPLFDAWLEAGVQAGFRRTDDVNGFRQEGFAAFDKNVHRGRRLSAARAYLHPALGRPNLTLVTRAHVNHLLFERSRCVGVEYRRNRRTHRVRAGEVISCGGAFNTPQLLQLSGIGDAEHLGGLGIDVVADVPGVGEDLQDHLEVYIQHACNEPVSMQPYTAKWRMPIIGLQWLARRGVRQVESRRAVPEPDVPLPADRDPLRRLVARRRPRVPGTHRPHVLRLEGHGEDHLDRSAGQAGDQVQLPVDRSRSP